MTGVSPRTDPGSAGDALVRDDKEVSELANRVIPAVAQWNAGIVLGICALLLTGLLFTLPAHAIFTEKPLENPGEEARAQELMKDMRCLVCQNQAISESQAPLARDMRIVLRERIAAGDSDEQAVNYMVDRFGDWVLLNPPFKTKTVILWISMPVMLLIGALLVFFFLRRQRVATPATVRRSSALDEQERSELRRALAEKE